MEIKKEVLDELIKHYKKPGDLIGETGLLKQLTKDRFLCRLEGIVHHLVDVRTVGLRFLRLHVSRFWQTAA